MITTDQIKQDNTIPYILQGLKPIAVYKYKSLLEEVIVSYKYDTVGFRDEFFSDRNDDIAIYDWFKLFVESIENKNPNVYIDTNKIVFVCKTKKGFDLNVSWYDGILSFGFGRRGDLHTKPIKLK